jgi:hypothetical protein
VFGAALWIGYFGSVIATHIRAESPLFTHTLFPIYIAALLWAGLWLRDGRLRRIYARHSTRRHSGILSRERLEGRPSWLARVKRVRS